MISSTIGLLWLAFTVALYLYLDNRGPRVPDERERQS